MPLHEKHALITGASRGIGRGWSRNSGADGFIVQADVCRPEQITRMFGDVKAKLGKLDIFVSNARPESAAFFQPPMDIALEQWDAAFDSQAKAFLIGVRETGALMSDGGRIIAQRRRGVRPLPRDQGRRRAKRSPVPPEIQLG